MSRRHSTSPDSKPITTRLHKLTALLDELAKAPHQPDDTAEFLPTKLLKRVLAYVGSGGARRGQITGGAVSRQTRSSGEMRCSAQL